MATFQDINCASKLSLMAADATDAILQASRLLFASLILNCSYYNLSTIIDGE